MQSSHLESLLDSPTLYAGLYPSFKFCYFGFYCQIRLNFIWCRLCVGIIGSSCTLSDAQNSTLFVKILVIEIFGSALGLFGVIVGIIMSAEATWPTNRYKRVWNCCDLWYLHWLSLVSRRTTRVRIQNLFWIPDFFLYCLKLCNNWRAYSSCLYYRWFLFETKTRVVYMICCWLIIEIEYFIQLIYLYFFCFYCSWTS